MGNDLIRAAQKPWEDCCKYFADSLDLTCKSACCGSPCECGFQTHPFQDASDPDLLPGAAGPRQDVPVVLENRQGIRGT